MKKSYKVSNKINTATSYKATTPHQTECLHLILVKINITREQLIHVLDWDCLICYYCLKADNLIIIVLIIIFKSNKNKNNISLNKAPVQLREINLNHHLDPHNHLFNHSRK